jgi:TonB family protein
MVHLGLKIGKGTPVPVRDPAVDATLASQVDLAAGVEPTGGGTLEGGGEVTIPPGEEPEPPPFRPVQIEPRVIRSVVPEYPRLAVETGMEGKVWVKVWVDEYGKVRKAVVIKGDAEVFNEAAVAAAMGFIFRPAIMNDRPVSVWVAIPFSFKLH